MNRRDAKGAEKVLATAHLSVHSTLFITNPVVVPAYGYYFACTVKTQYTIRAIPAAIDRALRRRAKQEAKSLNTVAVEVLARGLELDAKTVEHTDLDPLIGTWQEDPEFDRAIADFEQVDEDAWK